MSAEPYRVEMRPKAKAALRYTAQHITQASGAGQARDWLRAMLQSIDALETLPARFGVRGTWQGDDVHSRAIMGHLVYYTINETTRTVSIIDVAGERQHTKRAQYGDTGDQTAQNGGDR